MFRSRTCPHYAPTRHLRKRKQVLVMCHFRAAAFLSVVAVLSFFVCVLTGGTCSLGVSKAQCVSRKICYFLCLKVLTNNACYVQSGRRWCIAGASSLRPHKPNHRHSRYSVNVRLWCFSFHESHTTRNASFTLHTQRFLLFHGFATDSKI